MSLHDGKRGELRLYHAPSSYYSMIARFALAERGLAFTPVFVDIHARMSQQAPDYVRLNPHMTVPTLIGAGFDLYESRAIALYAFGLDEAGLDAETRGWLDLHYGYPIEELTFGRLLTRNPLAGFLFPKRLDAARQKLLKLADANPDLAGLYRERADVFAHRVLAFDPHLVRALGVRRQSEAIGFLDRLEAALGDGRAWLVTSGFGVADIVWIVFLARMQFTGLGAEIDQRPKLARYWHAAEARRSFAAADIWTRLHLGRLIAGILGLVK